MRIRLVVLLAITGLFGFAQIPTLTPLTKQQVWTGGAKFYPYWTGGAFVTLDLPLTNASAPTSPDPTAFVAAGEQNVTIPMRIPGAVWIGNSGIARGTDGTIAVVGDAKDESGRPWEYLAFFPPNYAPPVIIHTEPYHATGVTMLPDGSVWAVGVDTAPGSKGVDIFDKASTKGILRHYSRTGELLATLLPQSEFKPTQALWGHKIASGANRIGWCQYDGFGAGPQPQGGFYFEVSADGSVSKTPLPPFADGESVNTLTITDNGYVFLQKNVHANNPRLYVLDRAHGAWQALQFPAAGFQGTSYFLLGATANTLAFWTKGTTGMNAQFAAVE